MMTTWMLTISCLLIMHYFPIDTVSVTVISFALGLLDSWRFYSWGVLINSFPLHALSGMFITTLGSYFNFGRLTFIHTKLCGIYGWEKTTLIGLTLQIIILFLLPAMFSWVDKADPTLP